MSRRQPAPARRPRKGDLVVWEQLTSWARGGVTYHVGTAAHVRRDGQLAALADANGAPAWRAAWKHGRPPITRTWHLPAERVDVAGALAAVRATVARRQADLHDDAAAYEREGRQHHGATAGSLRQSARDLRHRARELAKVEQLLDQRGDVRALTAAVEARRRQLLARAGQLPPTRSYGPARVRLHRAADDCADVVALLRRVQP